jgi:hypothetical protein
MSESAVERFEMFAAIVATLRRRFQALTWDRRERSAALQGAIGHSAPHSHPVRPRGRGVPAGAYSDGDSPRGSSMGRARASVTRSGA